MSVYPDFSLRGRELEVALERARALACRLSRERTGIYHWRLFEPYIYNESREDMDARKPGLLFTVSWNQLLEKLIINV